LALGLLDEVVSAEDLESAATRAAEAFTQSTGRTVAQVKRQFRPTLHSGFDRPRDNSEFLDAWFSSETQRRVRAVVESLKR
jgi:enoyl-CoA hydratase/carnithine racemase